MSHRRRKPPARHIVAFLSVTQFVAGIGLLVAALSLAARTACTPLAAGSTSCAGLTGSGSLLSAASGPLSRADIVRLDSAAPSTGDNAFSLVDNLLAPFVDEAQRRRATRANAEPDYVERVDSTLNSGRVNFLFFGYGETYEPPYGPDFKGSISIFSLDLKTLTLSTVTLNHDIRAPEVERYRQHTDRKTAPTRIDQSYPVGGFEVMRRTVEDATGLSVDFQVAMDDSVLRRAVDEVFGGIAVQVPFAFDALPVYFDRVRYPEYHYAAGPQRLDGLQAVQYIKAVYKGPYDPNKELAVRKQVVVKAMLDAVRQESLNPLFWAKALNFLRAEIDRKSIAFDFDPATLVLQSVQQSALRAPPGRNFVLPTMGTSIYVVDQSSGDGGVEWITGSLNPIVRRDLRAGLYVDKSMSVPKGAANPYADDLVTGYWTAVRDLVKSRLSAGNERRTAETSLQ